MDDKIRVAMIYGSTREGRFCDTVAKWAATQIADRDDFVLEVIDPLALALPLRQEHGADGRIAALKRSIGNADAFIIVTPEYNHGYPGPLKLLIDSVYDEWKAKPVAFVSYGGLSGGLRAVEQLRQVFAELHAVSIRDTVSFINAWEQFDSNGKPLAPERSKRSMAAVLAQLHWWASALRSARKAKPYSEASA